MWEEGSQTRWLYVCLIFTHGELLLLLEGLSLKPLWVFKQEICRALLTYPHAHANSFMKNADMYMFYLTKI